MVTPRVLFQYSCQLFQLLFKNRDERFKVTIPIKTILDKYVLFNGFPSILGLESKNYSYKHIELASAIPLINGFLKSVNLYLKYHL